MRTYSIFHPYLFSFFSKSLYQDVGKHWRGLNFLYLLFLLALSWAVTLVPVQWQVDAFVRQEAPTLIEKLPQFTIHNGQVSIDQPEPYVVNDPDTGKPLFVVDTTGHYQSLADTEAQLLITKNQLMMRSNAAETRIFDLSEIQDFSLDQATIYQWLELGRPFVAPLAFPFVWLGSFLYRLIQVLIYALIGLAIAKLFNAELNFDALVRLAIIAITPVLVLDTLFGLLGVTIPFWSFLCFLLAMGYLTFGIYANRKEQVDPGYPMGQWDSRSVAQD